jgi:hypothetical protein
MVPKDVGGEAPMLATVTSRPPAQVRCISREHIRGERRHRVCLLYACLRECKHLKPVRQMQVVGWLPADESNFFDDNGDAAALWWASASPLASLCLLCTVASNCQGRHCEHHSHYEHAVRFLLACR